MRTGWNLVLVMVLLLAAGCTAPQLAAPVVSPAAEQPAATATLRPTNAPIPAPAIAPPVAATPQPGAGYVTTDEHVALQVLDQPENFPPGELALRGRSVEQATTPLDPATLAAPPAATVLDLADCAMQYGCPRDEAVVLAAHPPGVVRTDGALRITHSTGVVTVLRDVEGKDSIWLSYHYLGYVPAIGQHVLEVRYYEHADYLMLAAADGAATSMWALPLPSPDGVTLASARPDPFSTLNELPVVIWKAADGHITRQHRLLIHWFEPGVEGAVAEAEWLDAATLQIRAVKYRNQPLDTGEITVRLTELGPVAYLDGMLISRPTILRDEVISQNTITITRVVEYPQQVVFDVRRAQVGEKLYQERDYVFRELPAEVLGLNYFLFSNSAMEQTTSNYLHFTLGSPVTLYVAIDAEAAALPGWMADWQRLDEQVLTDDIPLQLYRKDFPAGGVTLGASWMTPASNVRSHYLLFVP